MFWICLKDFWRFLHRHDTQEGPAPRNQAHSRGAALARVPMLSFVCCAFVIGGQPPPSFPDSRETKSNLKIAPPQNTLYWKPTIQETNKCSGNGPNNSANNNYSNNKPNTSNTINKCSRHGPNDDTNKQMFRECFQTLKQKQHVQRMNPPTHTRQQHVEKLNPRPPHTTNM